MSTKSESPIGNGSLSNPDKSELCEDLDLLMVLGGKPNTDDGRKIIRDHQAKCTWCARPGRHRSLIGVLLDRDDQHTARLEQTFGPIDWAD